MALSDQIPTQSGFDRHSTGDEVLAGLDLTGKTAVVTGGYSGIGLETVRALVKRGARCLVPVRTPAKAQASLAEFGDAVDTVTLDLADLGTVKAAAADISARLDRLDMLINNAGIMACPEARVGPGWESQFGINHMGHFAFTQGLMPLLKATGDARVVVLSSAAHKMGGMRWDDVQFTDGYDKWKAYGQAKTANALFANGLARRLKPTGGLAFSLHPGAIFTPLQRHLPQDEQIALGWLGADGQPSEGAKRNFKSPEQGCATTLWAATSPKLAGYAGVYCEDADVAPPADHDGPGGRWKGVEPYAADDDAAERLWTLSEQLLADA